MRATMARCFPQAPTVRRASQNKVSAYGVIRDQLAYVEPFVGATGRSPLLARRNVLKVSMMSCILCRSERTASVMFLDAGEMPERSKGAVLKTAERKFRGFESLSLRWLCSRRFARIHTLER